MLKLSAEQLDQLRSLSTPAVANVIERFSLRLRNEGYTNATTACRLPRTQAMAGYAVTAKMRTAAPPMRGTHYPDRSDWWSLLDAAPKPSIIVIEDMDAKPGTGSVCGGMHGSVFRALGSIGVVTNGAVRDLPELEELGLHVYAGSVVASHAYAHIVEVGTPVTIGGLYIGSGDLLHGDMHGIVRIPQDIASDIYPRAQALIEHERRISDYCRQPGATIETLRELVAAMLPDEGKG